MSQEIKPTADVAIAQKDIQVAVYTREIEAQAGEIRALRSELGKTRAALDSERMEHGAKMADSQNRMSSLESEMAKLEKTLSEERAAAHAAQESFLSDAEFLREGNRSLMARLETAESEKAVLSSSNDKLTAENDRLTKELEAAIAYGKDQAEKLSAEKTASAQFKQKVDARFAEIASLKAKLKKAQDAEAAARRWAGCAERNLSATNRLLRECRVREDARRPAKRFHRLVKAVLPYGLVCMWKRMAYGIAEDKPLFYYPGFMKRTRRIVKFMLPYFLAAGFKRIKNGKKAV